MKNKKTGLQQTGKMETKTSLKQTRRRLSSRVERKRYDESKRLALRFSPTAWAKLLYFRDKTDNEVGGFGITEASDLLYIKEFVTVKQEVTPVSVSFNDEAVGDFFDTQVDIGRKPEQFARHWIHSHPADSAEPSLIDEETFTRVFGGCAWATMFIIGQTNQTYTRLNFNVGPGGQLLIPVQVDYGYDFGPSDKEAWDAEYQANIRAIALAGNHKQDDNIAVVDDFDNYALPYDFIDELESMETCERQFILDELADRPELWDEESEVMCL